MAKVEENKPDDSKIENPKAADDEKVDPANVRPERQATDVDGHTLPAPGSEDALARERGFKDAEDEKAKGKKEGKK